MPGQHSSNSAQVSLKVTEGHLEKSLVPPLHHFEDRLSLADGDEHEHHQCDAEWSQEQHSDLLQLLVPGLWLQLHSLLALRQVSSSKEHSQTLSEKLPESPSQGSSLSTAFQRTLPNTRSTEVTEEISRRSMEQGLRSWKHGWHLPAERRSSEQGCWTGPCGRHGQSTQAEEH